MRRFGIPLQAGELHFAFASELPHPAFDHHRLHLQHGKTFTLAASDERGKFRMISCSTPPVMKTQ